MSSPRSISAQIATNLRLLLKLDEVAPIPVEILDAVDDFIVLSAHILGTEPQISELARIIAALGSGKAPLGFKSGAGVRVHSQGCDGIYERPGPGGLARVGINGAAQFVPFTQLELIVEEDADSKGKKKAA